MAKRAYNKRDQNEPEITDALTEHRIPYRLVPPGAGYDIIASPAPERVWFIEVKMPGGKMTKNELEFNAWCDSVGLDYKVMRTENDVRDAVKFAQREAE